MSDGFSLSEQWEAEQCDCGHSRAKHKPHNAECAMKQCQCGMFREPVAPPDTRDETTRNTTEHLRAALAREKAFRTELAALKDKARRLIGWRVVGKFDGCDHRSGICDRRHVYFIAAERRARTDVWSDVRIVRVYRKRREAGEG